MKKVTIPLFVLLAPLASAQGWGTHLTEDGQEADAWLGTWVSVGPDMNQDGLPELLVSSGNADGLAGADVGKVFALSGYDGQLVFEWEGEEAYDHFGGRVVIVGDVNNDGIDDIGVSAGGHYGLQNYGKVYIYSGHDGTELLRIFGSVAEEYFGVGFSALDDINGDGHADFAVGTRFTNSTPDIVRVFSGATGAELWRVTNPVSNTKFGGTIAPISDLDGDGINDLILGAKQEDVGGPNTGTIYLYSGLDGHLLDQVFGIEPGAELGEYVGEAGDINGDGVADVVASAVYADPNGKGNAGSVYVFSGANLGDVLFRLDGLVSNDYMGWTVVGGTDWNADGIPDIACGAPGTTHEWSSALGSVHIFSGKDGSLVHTLTGTDPGAFFGGNIAGLPDVSGDGSADLLVSARFFDTAAGIDAGQITVFASPGTFDFSVQGLSPGAPVTLSASGCRPNSTVHPVYSVQGSGMTWTSRFALSIAGPQHNLPAITMNGAGSGFEVLYVPPHVQPGLSVLWQPVEVWNNSGQMEYRVANVLETVVQ